MFRGSRGAPMASIVFPMTRGRPLSLDVGVALPDQLDHLGGRSTMAEPGLSCSAIVAFQAGSVTRGLQFNFPAPWPEHCEERPISEHVVEKSVG